MMAKPMLDKTVAITGASSGIGFETAKALAKMGAHVVMICRNAQRGETARETIVRETGNEHIDLHLADMSRQRDIFRVAGAIKKQYDKIDVLVNNAGAIFGRRELSEDGIEITFAVNHMGYFLLTRELLEVLKASTPARIVNVASQAHRGVDLDFDDLMGETNYDGWLAYQRSKLANILFTYELDRRLQGSGVAVNCLHPGVVSTNFGRQGPATVSLFFKVARPFLTSPRKGAATSIYLASSPEVEGVSGRYFIKQRPRESSPESYNKTAWERLWQVSEDLIRDQER
ncbi:MAG: SDR family oxidoreductase [candidate division KSB1 bacterium]|nr:SDR family oxidoreductase [candidate division KSB1 bacterium]